VPQFNLIALTPPGLTDPSVATAAARAGAWGVLDLEYTTDVDVARSIIGRLVRDARRSFGIKFDGRADEFMAQVISELPDEAALVILTASAPDQLGQQIQALRQQERTILVEAICLEEMLLADQAGADGLIVKGHEAGGRVGQETAFVLLQQALGHLSLPTWVQGGIGLHTAAACYAGGAAGVVLDAQLALTRESPLTGTARDSVSRMDGSETVCLGNELGAPYRVYGRRGLAPVENLRETSLSLLDDPRPRAEILAAWHQAVGDRVGWGPPQQHVWLLGQDVAFAAPLAQRFRTVGGVLQGIKQAVDEHARAARLLRPLDEGAPLAGSHRTRYPIVQGPMARISDAPEFAARVAENGGLPFLALSMMRASEVEARLRDTQQLLGDAPWGVGILGFAPPEIRTEQLRVIQAIRPPFALIAGGRPDQARELEQEGIPTYLHVPSPELLRIFIRDGARRFIFEGREGGGHIGPRSSFVLWDGMIDVLLDELPNGKAEACHVLFAGGIHDALSASMVAAMAAPLAERGARIGVLLGTAYLFTSEAVASGAILHGFQEEALRCTHTVVLESGPGHAVRCAETPFTTRYQQEKQRLALEGRSPEEIRSALEEMELGRLRMASKGIMRHPRYGQEPETPKFVTLSGEDQHAEGLYMIGQVAALRDRICSIGELHREIAVQGSKRLAEMREPHLAQVTAPREEQPCDVAIIGMACLMPSAPDVRAYWENILNKVNAITEIPPDRWDWRLYYDPDLRVRDKVHSRWGGFMDDVPFDPTQYGIPPSALPSVDPVQLLALDIVRAALGDAGYAERPFDRENTSVVFGASGGIGSTGELYTVRAWLPHLLGDVPPDILDRLPEWTEDSFPGLLLSVIAGRVANRFDLHGANFTVDAACASAMAALYIGVRELETGSSNVVIVGGADTVQNPFAYLCFGKVRALSPRGRCRTFDETADGTVIGEGVGALVLKRLADAERDGDRIYAVIKGVGRSSDGRARGLTAPEPAGQVRALERAYRKAGLSPATVGLIEAHGTGTVAGDRAEVESLMRVFGAASEERQFCGIGSVKSMVGHLKATAAVAGLIKSTLALYYKVLPPTIGVDKPNPAANFPESAFYVNTEPRPWINSSQSPDGTADQGVPRRVGVSAFGFGGTNFHTVLEEYTGDFLESGRPMPLQHWPSELLLWAADSRQELVAAVQSLEQALASGAQPALSDLAYTLSRSLQGDLRLAIVATSLEDLQEKLAQAREALSVPGATEIEDPRGIYFTEKPLAQQGRIAFLFPGQGSQYPGMLSDLALIFPEVRDAFQRADWVLAPHFAKPLSRTIFPPPAFSKDERKAQAEALTQTHVAQSALGAANIGFFHLLQALGVHPDMVAGHSYGEYVALCAAGVFDETALFTLSEARGRIIEESSSEDLGTMAAVRSGPEAIADIVNSIDGVWMANLNTPKQTIISGKRTAVKEAIARLKEQGVRARTIPVACAFHSPVMAPAQKRLAEFLSSVRETGAVQFCAPEIEVFSNTLAAPYPRDPAAAAAILQEHLLHPVQFVHEIEAMYDAGARVFVEVGPNRVLTGLARGILGSREAVVIPVDATNRSGLLQLHHALGQLAAHGVAVKLERLYQGRSVRRLNLQALVEETKEHPLPPTTWLVNGGGARPLKEPRGSRAHSPVAAGAESPHPATPDSHATSDAGAATVRQSPTPAVSSPDPVSAPVTPGVPASEQSSVPIAPPEVRAPSVASQITLCASGNGADQVMAQYQQLMRHFLDTQRSVMLTYLQGAPGVADQEATSLTQTTPRPAVKAVPVAAEPSATSAPASLMAPMPAAPVASSAAEAASATAGQAASEQQKEGAPAAAEDPHPAPEARTSPPHEAQLVEQLLQIVSDRTGYPAEMLDLDLDMEADLGIDSIKRVEILGAFQRTCFPSEGQLPPETMEHLTGVKTLGGIASWISGLAEAPDEAERASPGAGAAERMPAPRADALAEQVVEVPRSVLVPVEAPLSDGPSQPVEGRLFLITDDQRGIAQAVAEELQRRGGRVALVRQGDHVHELGEGLYTADLGDPAAVEQLLEQVRRRQGPLVGLLHLLPLRAGPSFQATDLTTWRERLRTEVKSCFYLARAASSDLQDAGASGGGWLLAATAMGGTFAVGSEASGAFFPGQGGLAGLVKTVALEWPSVSCRAVDLDPEDSIATISQQLLREMTTGGGQDGDPVEVGYRDSRRLILQPTLAPLASSGPANLEINSDWVVLVTGGARGIMAEVARELAERYQPTLVLCGRSPLPDPEEPADTAGLTSARDLKAALIARMRRSGQAVTPAQVEAATSRLLKDRDMRASLAAMQAAGATVHYHQVDVRDEGSLRGLIEELYRVHGRLDGVIHGAGVIEDKLIEDKTPESFARVFDTKADSAFVLSRALRPDSLRFLVLFASAAGRFGNRGQSDYAAANEVMSKLAEHLNRCWPGRVVAINWGPWLRRPTAAGAGMVSPELQRQFAERGIQIIPFATGRRALDRELRYGHKEQAEVVVAGGGEWGIAEAQSSSDLAARLSPERLPLLQSPNLMTRTNGTIEVAYTLDPSDDLCLRDHQLDGQSVLPVAAAIELLAEVASEGWPGLEVVGLQDIRVLNGIVLRNGPEKVRVVAQPAKGPRPGRGWLIQTEIRGPNQNGHAYYRATVELAERLPVPPPFNGGLPANLHGFPESVEEVYRRYLFHGPTLQCISKIEGIADEGIVASVTPSTPQDCLAGRPTGEWLIDPVVIDSGFQLAIVWARVQHDFTPLPSRFRVYHRYGPLIGRSIRCVLHTRAHPDSLTMHTDLFFVSHDGRVLGAFEGAESTCSRALNRLAGQQVIRTRSAE
jgi:acyl transferase domain-containing protein/NAD(P)H-dependent flavin oxidoreductase YrpB (nitropropane dioxygenase family)